MWMYGVTRLDRIPNERRRGSLRVKDIADNVQESRLRWFDYFLRRFQS